MSPEALTDSMFTTMSDVWSFGVVMWEVYMLGQMPYPGIDPSQLVRQLARGFRMSCPPACPEDIYQVRMTAKQRWPLPQIVAVEPKSVWTTASLAWLISICPSRLSSSLLPLTLFRS
jgi:serine/threonine protein kinase